MNWSRIFDVGRWAWFGVLVFLCPMKFSCADSVFNESFHGAAVSAARSSTTSANETQSALAWSRLQVEQQRILASLAPPKWNQLSQLQQRQWVALTRGYFHLSPRQQAKIQDQMRAWADLTPAQRQLARKHFAQVQSVSRQNKQRSWQSYQALSLEEKHRLVQVAQSEPGRSLASGAAVVKTCAALICQGKGHFSRSKPRIEVRSSHIYQRTLLPRQQTSDGVRGAAFFTISSAPLPIQSASQN
jgi:hypothetical protein